MQVARPGAVSTVNPTIFRWKRILSSTPSWHTDKTFSPAERIGAKEAASKPSRRNYCARGYHYTGYIMGCRGLASSTAGRGGRGDTTIKQESKNKIHIRRKDISNYRFVSRAVTSGRGGGGGGGSVARHPQPSPGTEYLGNTYDWITRQNKRIQKRSGNNPCSSVIADQNGGGSSTVLLSSSW